MCTFQDTIVDTQYILSGKTFNDDCIFLNVTREVNDSDIVANIDLEIVYAPTNPAIDEIMQIIQVLMLLFSSVRKQITASLIIFSDKTLFF